MAGGMTKNQGHTSHTMKLTGGMQTKPHSREGTQAQSNNALIEP